MIRALIVDDELKSQTTLQKLLERYCTGVDVIGFANNVKSAVEEIEKLNPDLVFLDISMPDGDGFEVLERVSKRDFEVVFTTAYNDYAIKAFQFAALHYLLKPINYMELQKAVERYKENKKDVDLNHKIEVLYQSLNNEHEKIILPTNNGMKVVALEDIMYCRAEGSYTYFYFSDNEELMVSKSLSSFEGILPSKKFSRVHSKYLVNLNYVSQYVKGRAGMVVLTNGYEIDVSEGRKSDFLTRLKKLAHFLPDRKN